MDEIHWRIQARGRQGRPPRGPNSFIFMQFTAKKSEHTHFGSWRPHLRKILDLQLKLFYHLFALIVLALKYIDNSLFE